MCTVWTASLMIQELIRGLTTCLVVVTAVLGCSVNLKRGKIAFVKAAGPPRPADRLETGGTGVEPNCLGLVELPRYRDYRYRNIIANVSLKLVLHASQGLAS